MSRSTYVTLQTRGVLALPADVRRRHHLDHPGAQVELREREDGVIELRPHLAVPADQAWFWSARWQAMEREVEEHVAKRETAVHDDADAFIAHLDELKE